MDTGSEPYADGKCGYIDTNGKMVIQPQFRSAGNFSEGLASVCRYADKSATSEKEGYIDRSGRMVIEPKFSLACDFHEGLARVEILPDKVPPEASEEEQERPPEAKWGFIDKTGKFVIKPQFAWADDFVHGRAKVSVGKKRYQIDTKGNLYEVNNARSGEASCLSSRKKRVQSRRVARRPKLDWNTRKA